MKGVTHYTKDGKPFKGKTHKMKDGTLHTGASHCFTLKTCQLVSKKKLRKNNGQKI